MNGLLSHLDQRSSCGHVTRPIIFPGSHQTVQLQRKPHKPPHERRPTSREPHLQAGSRQVEPAYPLGGRVRPPLPHVLGSWPCYPPEAAPLPTSPCRWEHPSLSVPPALLACSLSLPAAALSSSMSPSSRCRLQPPSPATNPIPCVPSSCLHWACFYIPALQSRLLLLASSFISPSHAGGCSTAFFHAGRAPRC